VSTPLLVDTVDDVTTLTASWRRDGHTIAVVPTMGALHEGHLALVRRAKELADHVVVTIFVNPLQFGPGEDFQTYPRDVRNDVELLRDTGVDAVFAPGVDTVYPDGATQHMVLDAGKVGDLFEGESRPGHFDGVLTVVKRLFDIVQPDIAVFGKKDAQQLFLIRQMVEHEKLPVAIHEVDTVRAPNGLALSSRNAYLDESGLEAARTLSEALEAAAKAPSLPEALSTARSVIEREARLSLDYLEVVDPDTFLPTTTATQALMIVAARVGPTRLIDNRELRFHQ
jgi:pantoate--beta-alanine ligase